MRLSVFKVVTLMVSQSNHEQNDFFRILLEQQPLIAEKLIDTGVSEQPESKRSSGVDCFDTLTMRINSLKTLALILLKTLTLVFQLVERCQPGLPCFQQNDERYFLYQR